MIITLKLFKIKTLNKIDITLLLIISALSWNTYWQKSTSEPIKNSPLTTETLFSNRRMSLQMIMGKKFQSIPQFGIFRGMG